ncbi:MAG: hypothetical protein LUE86_10875 [Clostridiales bacterium]|nr:hypothetical protein [Clostridiales bacterium]
MKKRILILACVLSALATFPAAGGIVRGEGGVWYDNGDGTWPTGWFEDEDGSWYYFDSDGYAREGWYTLDGISYYFRYGSGTMTADRTITIDGRVWRFDENGAGTRLSANYNGWMKDDIGWYYRLSGGSFVTNAWRQINGSWYYFDADGYMQTGALVQGGVFYYLKGNGEMARNETLTVDGVSYQFDENGAGTANWPYKSVTVIPPEEEKTDMEKTVDAMCDQILAGLVNEGMSKRQKATAIYGWVRGSFRYTGSSATRDWVTEAYQGLRSKHGDCYTYFAVSQALLTRAGIRCIEVVRVDNDHFWNLVELEDGWWHFDTTPRRAGGYFCLWTDAQMADYSRRNGGCFEFDRSLYPATP